MISFNEALQIIDKHKIETVFVIKKCLDIGDRYAFYLDYKNADPLFPTPGVPILCIGKENGEISELTVPPIKNLDILNRGTEIELPEK